MPVFQMRNMKLKVKILFVPVGIVVLAFMVMGVLIAKEVMNKGHMEHLDGRRKLIQTTLSLLTSTQIPADAIMGLAAGDDIIAKEILQHLKQLDLSRVFFIDKDMKYIYPEDVTVLKGLNFLSDASLSKRGRSRIYFKDASLIGFSQIIDVETPVGYLVVMDTIPDEISANTVLRMTNTQEEAMSPDVEGVMNELKYQSNGFLKKILLTLGMIMLPCLVLIVFILRATSGYIILRINELLHSFKKLAEGNLSESLEFTSNDELGQLAMTYNQTNSKLRIIIEDLILSINTLSKSFEEVAASISELSAVSSDVSETALNGGNLVALTAEGMKKIRELVNEADKTINVLGKRSQEIGGIVETINDIADQTNLLALNAAIEAARAGESGRGFAVVADEVRKLAEKTSQATKNIKDRIESIQHDTKEAVTIMKSGTSESEKELELATEAGIALQQIVTSTITVKDTIMQIAATVEEQSCTSKEVTEKIESTFHTGPDLTDMDVKSNLA